MGAASASAASGAVDPDLYGLVLTDAVDALSGGRDGIGSVVVRRLSRAGMYAAVWDFDTAARELVCRHTSEADFIDRRIALGVGVAGWVASHRRPAIVQDRRADRRGDHYAGHEIPSCGAAVPIPGGESYTGGVLEVYVGSDQEISTEGLIALTRIAAVIAAGKPVPGDPSDSDSARRDAITEVERQNRRMAAELHDGVSQRLASLSFHLSAASSALAELSPETEDGADPVHFALRQLGIAVELGQLASDDVRAAISGLRPPVLDDLGLARGLVSLCGALGAEDLAVEVDVEAVEPPFVSPAASLALYRVAQEALGNAIKHAGVASVRVRLKRRGGNVVLDVRDDGVGYRQDPGSVTGVQATATDSGLGLRSMAERMQAIGGHIELWSAPGRGTQVRAIVRD